MSLALDENKATRLHSSFGLATSFGGSAAKIFH